MHAPASLTGARRRLLQVPTLLRSGKRPGMPGGRPAATAAGCIAGLVLLLALILVYTPIAHPKTLVVRGVTGSSEARITSLLEEAASKQSTFAVSRDRLMRSVAAYPEVAGVEVQSHPPFRLEIRAIMRPPVGRVEIGGRAFVIAGDGTVLQRAGNADVPKLDESVGTIVVRDGHISGARAALAVLAAAPEPLLQIARTVRAGHAGIEVEMSRGPRLVFGNAGQAADKWAAAAAIIADGSAEAATYIDLRVPARPAVGGIGGTESAASMDPPTLTSGQTNAPINGDPEASTAGTGTGTGTAAGTGTSSASGTGAPDTTGGKPSDTGTATGTANGTAPGTADTTARQDDGTTAAPDAAAAATPQTGTTVAPAAGQATGGGAAIGATP